MTPHFSCHARHAVVASVCLLLYLLTSPSYAAGRVELHVSESQGVYSINLVMQMQVPARYVHRVLTDYVHIYRLDPAIIDSEILPSSEAGVVRVRTRIADCIALFCIEIDRVEDVRKLGHDTLQVTTSRDVLEAMAAGEGPRDALVALGYAGWGAGQLEEEMTANAWLTVPASREIIFQIPFEDRWRSAAALIGIDIDQISSDVGHA